MRCDDAPVSFLACVSDGPTLESNLLRSPCLIGGSPHEVVAVKNCPSAAAGLNLGLERAQCEFVVCVHQDVYLPAGWDRCLMQQLQEAERRFGPIGVAGVDGVGEVIEPEDSGQPLRAERIGWVVDRGRVLRDGPELPAQVATLDELLLVVRRDSGLRFDPDLGFHLYGADICLQARERGLAVVALAALLAITIPVALGCRRRFTGARRSSLANGAIGCRSPRRALSLIDWERIRTYSRAMTTVRLAESIALAGTVGI